MIAVLLADDQPLLRTGFSMILEAQPDMEVAGEAADGEQAVAQAAALHPDVVLMDVRMPHTDGIEATRQIVASGSTARIIILTTHDVDEYVFAALRAGASGFLLKDVRPPDLVDGIRVVARGDALLAASVTRRLLDRFASVLPDGSATPADLGELTAREVEVLRLVADGQSNKQIGDVLGLSALTVKSHLARIARKLGTGDRAEMVALAMRAGVIR